MKFRTVFAICMVSGTLPAAADSRDLVLDRMSRCYTLTDTRQYLDCLYGAVQPLRNELALPQAPQAAAFAALFARPSPQNSYAASVPAARVQPQPQREQGFTSGLLSSVMGMETRKVAPEQFGLRNARPGAGTNVDHITARMAQYGFDRTTGHFTVTLDNGQVWRQHAGDERNPTWNKPAPSYVATIDYGANGTFNLVVAGERQAHKVQRIR